MLGIGRRGLLGDAFVVLRDLVSDSLLFLFDGVTPPSKSVALWRFGVVVVGGFTGVPGCNAAFDSCHVGEWSGGHSGCYEAAVGAVPGDFSGGSHGGVYPTVGFGVVVVAAEALQVGECGPATCFVIDHMVDVATVRFNGASGESAGEVPELH